MIRLIDRLVRHPASHRKAGRAAAARPFVVLLGICLTACANAPAAISTTGSLQPASFRLSPAEQHWNCNGLENAVQARITTIISLSAQAKAAAADVAPTLSVLFARMSGHGDEANSALQQMKSERIAADSYNAQLKAKGCPAVDIDAKLQAAGVPTQI